MILVDYFLCCLFLRLAFAVRKSIPPFVLTWQSNFSHADSLPRYDGRTQTLGNVLYLSLQQHSR